VTSPVATPEMPSNWEADNGARRHAPATERNRDAIAAVLADVLPNSGNVLEIASGTGEHVAHFAERFPTLSWQPSDPDPSALASIASWTAGLGNVATPVAIDATDPGWPVDRVDALLCVNMVHIAPWEATLGLISGAAAVLADGAPLILYGPYLRGDVATAPSNLAFDASLKSRDARWGLRSVEDVTAAATARGLDFDRVVEMPANNLMLIFRVGRSGVTPAI
jgi:hypothetical protein